MSYIAHTQIIREEIKKKMILLIHKKTNLDEFILQYENFYSEM